MDRLQRNLGVALVFTAILAGTALSMSGCSHALTIKNMNSYTKYGAYIIGPTVNDWHYAVHGRYPL